MNQNKAPVKPGNGRETGRKKLYRAAAVLFWIAVWWMAACITDNELLLPAPPAVAAELGRLCTDGGFWSSIALSVCRIAAGFAAGCIAGCALAAVGARIPFVRALLSPLMTLLRSVPVASFIMLVILILKRDTLPVFICFIMVVPLVWSSVSMGLDSVPQKYKELVRAYRMSGTQRIFRLYLPWTLPYFAQGAVNAMGFAWKAGIAAEVLCQPALAVGSGIYNAKIYLQTPTLFAWTAVVVVLSLVLEKLLESLLANIRRNKRYDTEGSERNA